MSNHPLSPFSITYRDPESLKPHPRRARRHSKRQLRQLEASVRQFGLNGAPVVDENGVVLAGHALLEVLQRLGMRLIPTIQVVGLTEAEKRAYMLADNKIAENAGWDLELLESELAALGVDLPLEGLDISLTGFELAEIEALGDLRRDAKPEPLDDVPAVAKRAITRPGDLWRLGGHRILCGDALTCSILGRVLGGIRADAVITDPPYNVRINGHARGRGKAKLREFAAASGEMTEAEFRAFLQAALGTMVTFMREGALAYVFMDWRHIADLIAAGTAIFGSMLNLCVWTKSNGGQGSFYRSQHELIGLFRNGDTPHQNNVELGRYGRNRSNVWPYAGVNAFGRDRAAALRDHPTVKPVMMIADALRDCTSRGGVVLDPFLGSGTTVLAAEMIGRRAFGTEIDPLYVDVTLRRWQAYTKDEAVLEGDGRTFAEIADARGREPEAGPSPPPALLADHSAGRRS